VAHLKQKITVHSGLIHGLQAVAWLSMLWQSNVRRRTVLAALSDFKDVTIMMDALRQGAKGWVAKVLLTLLIASFAVWGITDVFRGFQNADLVTVGDKSISSETFRRDLNTSIQQFKNQTGTALSLEDARKLGLEKQVLDQMISRASIDAQGERLGIEISDQAVANSIQSQQIFHDSKGVFDVARFRNLLQQNGMTEDGYVQSEKENLLRTWLSNVAGDNITLPRTMLEALTRYRDETRDGRYVSFSVNASDVPQPTDADLKKLYEATPSVYTAPEYRSIAVMKVDPSDMASKIQITDEEIANAYDTFKVEYYEPERRDILQLSFPDVAAAEKAKLRIDSGEDILKLAAELGQKEKDITFANKLIGDFLDEKIGEAAFALSEGAMSPAVKGSLNTVLLKAVKVVAAKQPTLDELKAVLKERLQLEKAREEIVSVYDAVENDRAIPLKFEEIAAKAGLSVIVVPAISAGGIDKAGQQVSLPAKDDVLKTAFASDVGLDIDALNVNDGYVWVDVREVIPSAVRPFEDVKENVKADWAAAQLRTLAGDKAKAIVEKAGAGSRLESIATELGGQIKSVTSLKRSSSSEVFDGGSTLALFSVGEKALAWALEGDGKSARIIEVTKVNLPQGTATASAKEVQDVAKRGLGSDLMDSYVKSAKASTTVTVNEELWRQISGSTTTQ
jgi:peptidyl-prolyl cis-trans isomerase D